MPSSHQIVLDICTCDHAHEHDVRVRGQLISIIYVVRAKIYSAIVLSSRPYLLFFSAPLPLRASGTSLLGVRFMP